MNNKIKLNNKLTKYLKKNFNIDITGSVKRSKRLNLDLTLESPCKLSIDSLLYNEGGLSLGAFSYLDGTVTMRSKTKIGRYCSIADGVKIGLDSHPLDQLSTSPFFYYKNWLNRCNKNIKLIDRQDSHNGVEIGNDVWVGCNALIMNGIKIGDGAVIGSGAIISKNVPPYAVVVGANRILRYRDRPKEFNKQKDWWIYRQDKKNLTGFSPFILNKASLLEISKKLKWKFINYC